MKPSWSIRLVRSLFFALSVFVGIAIALVMGEPAWVGALLGLAYMGILIGLDIVFARFSLRDFSHATVGLAIGLFCAWLVRALLRNAARLHALAPNALVPNAIATATMTKTMAQKMAPLRSPDNDDDDDDNGVIVLIF